ncbi:hypothetical protein F5Y03DRAFT_402309 [Xylaria venustula]|nr:hypothetical protein F5Y03DRAFT_402309 [Xylaria venustula]
MSSSLTVLVHSPSLDLVSGSGFSAQLNLEIARDASESSPSSSSEDNAVAIDVGADTPQTESSNSTNPDEDPASGYESSCSANSNNSADSNLSLESDESYRQFRRVFANEGLRLLKSIGRAIDAFEDVSLGSLKSAVGKSPAREDPSLFRFLQAEFEEFISETRDVIHSQSRDSTLAGPLKHALEQVLLDKVEEWGSEFHRTLRRSFVFAVKNRVKSPAIATTNPPPYLLKHPRVNPNPVKFFPPQQTRQLEATEDSTHSKPKNELLRVLEQDKQYLLPPPGPRSSPGHPQPPSNPGRAGPTTAFGRTTAPPGTSGHGSLPPGRIARDPPPPGTSGRGQLVPVLLPSFVGRPGGPPFPPSHPRPGSPPRALARKSRSQCAVPGWLVEGSHDISLLK